MTPQLVLALALTIPQPPQIDKAIFSYQDARAESLRTGKPILIYLKTTECVWCDRMAKETFQDATVKAILKRFVVAKLDENDAQDVLSWCEKQGRKVEGFPTCVIVAADRKPTIVRHVGGFQPPGVFRAILLAAEAWATNLRPQ